MKLGDHGDKGMDPAHKIQRLGSRWSKNVCTFFMYGNSSEYCVLGRGKFPWMPVCCDFGLSRLE